MAVAVHVMTTVEEGKSEADPRMSGACIFACACLGLDATVHSTYTAVTLVIPLHTLVLFACPLLHRLL